MRRLLTGSLLAAAWVQATAVGQTTKPTTAGGVPLSPDGRAYLSQPLVTSIYTADPSAHVFGGRVYIYCSHDVSDGPSLPDVEPFKGSKGNAFKMCDYRVLSMDGPGATVTVHDVALDLKDVPWAARQLWAPDAAFKDGTYYLYFPAKDKAGAFRIGVATSKSPVGPFAARPEPIAGSYSIDPAVFVDDDGKAYMYFGGLSGGQLQSIVDGKYQPSTAPADAPKSNAAMMPKVAPLRADMLEFAAPPRDAMILDDEGRPLAGGEGGRRFFEACWMHKYDGKYYLSYSSGGTHFINYAIGDSPLGPFTYKGHVLLPVQGWTTHHSIVKIGDRWWLFYADTQLSDKTWLRCVKMTELFYNADGTIQPIDPFVGTAKP